MKVSQSSSLLHGGTPSHCTEIVPHSDPLPVNGDSDVSATPSQFLVLRKLEPHVTEKLLAGGVSKLYKPDPDQALAAQIGHGGKSKMKSTTVDSSIGATRGSLHRVLLMRDRISGNSLRFGFAEFKTVDVSMQFLGSLTY